MQQQAGTGWAGCSREAPLRVRVPSQGVLLLAFTFYTQRCRVLNVLQNSLHAHEAEGLRKQLQGLDGERWCAVGGAALLRSAPWLSASKRATASGGTGKPNSLPRLHC